MSDYLKWEQYIQDACNELDDGQTSRIDHTTCSAGEDRRARLYLTKPHHGGRKVLAYCHNCAKGRVFNVDEGYRVPHGPPEDYTRPLSYNLPLNIEDYDSFNTALPNDVMDAVRRYGISIGMAIEAQIRYDPDTHRLVLPMYEEVEWRTGPVVRYSKLKGVQKKLIRPVGRQAKYITEMNDEDSMHTFLRCYRGVVEKSATIIVEDYLSAVRIIQWARYNETWHIQVMCNYGTKVNPIAMNMLDDTDQYIVWLDNDSAHVISQGKSISDVLSLLKPGKRIWQNATLSDPKKCSYDEIEGVLNGQR